MTDKMDSDGWKIVQQNMTRADEAYDLYQRGLAVFPIAELPGVKKHNSELEKRWKAKDPRVKAYFMDGGEEPDFFEQELTKKEKDALVTRYLNERTSWGNHYNDEQKLDAAELFVEIIAGYGFELPVSAATIPPSQKERQRVIESAAAHFESLVDSLNKLDSAALGWVFALVEEKATEVGISLRPAGPDVVSLRNDWFRAQVEAGEARSALDLLARKIGPAIRDAATTLPKIDRVLNDPRLESAFALERRMQEHMLPFDIKETGFAAECLRTIFELANLDTDRVSYWLKKAADTPDDEVPYFGAIRKKTV